MSSDICGRVRVPHRPTAEITVHRIGGITRSVRLTNIMVFGPVRLAGGEDATVIRLKIGGQFICRETFAEVDRLINGTAVSHE